MKFEDHSTVRAALKERIGYPHLIARYTPGGRKRTREAAL